MALYAWGDARKTAKYQFVPAEVLDVAAGERGMQARNSHVQQGDEADDAFRLVACKHATLADSHC